MYAEFIIDRIEGDNVIIECDDDTIINVSSKYIVGNPKEGDVLIKENGKYIIDKEATIKRRLEIEKLMKGMWSE